MTPRHLAVLSTNPACGITADDDRLVDHDPLPGVRPLDDFQDQFGHGAESITGGSCVAWSIFHIGSPDASRVGDEFTRIFLARAAPVGL